MVKRTLPRMGTIHGTLASLVHPNQNKLTGRQSAPIIAGGRRSSGTNRAPSSNLGFTLYNRYGTKSAYVTRAPTNRPCSSWSVSPVALGRSVDAP